MHCQLRLRVTQVCESKHKTKEMMTRRSDASSDEEAEKEEKEKNEDLHGNCLNLNLRVRSTRLDSTLRARNRFGSSIPVNTFLPADSLGTPLLLCFQPVNSLGSSLESLLASAASSNVIRSMNRTKKKTKMTLERTLYATDEWLAA